MNEVSFRIRHSDCILARNNYNKTSDNLKHEIRKTKVRKKFFLNEIENCHELDSNIVLYVCFL